MTLRKKEKLSTIFTMITVFWSNYSIEVCPKNTLQNVGNFFNSNEWATYGIIYGIFGIESISTFYWKIIGQVSCALENLVESFSYRRTEFLTKFFRNDKKVMKLFRKNYHDTLTNLRQFLNVRNSISDNLFVNVFCCWQEAVYKVL